MDFKIPQSLNIFRTNQEPKKNQETKIKQSEAHSNPFGVSFKGNVIQADVFESNERQKNELNDKMTNGSSSKIRFYASALLNGLNTFNNKLQTFGNKVVSFGRDIKDKTSNIWQTFQSINVEDMFIVKKDSVKYYEKMPVENIEKEFIDSLIQEGLQ